MKKIVTLLLATILLLTNVLLLSACNNSYSDQNTNPNQASDSSDEHITDMNDFHQDSSEQNNVCITVTNKRNIPKNTSNGQYSDRVEFTFKIDNLTSKSIQGIQGTLTIYDLFNDKIISINCDFTGDTISPNSSMTVNDLGIDINQFMDNHIELYNEKFEDLIFKYKITNIVYTDSNSSNQQNNSSNNQTSNKVKIEVTNKYNKGKDYDAGRYSERVEFNFKITNKSSKAIKGIQGTLIIKDLFGKDIISINCDFTGETISPNKYITVTDLGMDINQFMDNHVKLYNEKYEDLKFEYIIKSISTIIINTNALIYLPFKLIIFFLIISDEIIINESGIDFRVRKGIIYINRTALESSIAIEFTIK